VKRVVEHIDRICLAFNAHVAIICHTNSEGDIKGNRALRDGVDIAWKVEKNGETMQFTCDKMRGAPETETFYACMRSIVLDENNPQDTAPIICSIDRNNGLLMQFTPKTQLQMLAVLQETETMNAGEWIKACKEKHNITRSTFYFHLKKITSDEFVVSEPKNAPKGTRVKYSLTEKGQEFLESSPR
jgi:DNA-binding HxlR family transcriptional regulator